MLALALFLAQAVNPITMHVVVDGIDREAIVFRPSHVTSAKPPVLFAFHGHGGSAERLSSRSKFEKLWPEAVVVYPKGLPTVIQVPTEHGPGWKLEIKESNRDIKLFDALRKEVLARFNGNPDQIFAFGFSNGAMFMYTLWNLRGSQIAGLGSSEGCMLEEMKLSPPTPFFITIGSDDINVPVQYQQEALEKAKKANRSSGEGTVYDQQGIFFKGEQPVVYWPFQGGHEYPLDCLPSIIRFFSDICKHK